MECSSFDSECQINRNKLEKGIEEKEKTLVSKSFWNKLFSNPSGWKKKSKLAALSDYNVKVDSIISEVSKRLDKLIQKNDKIPKEIDAFIDNKKKISSMLVELRKLKTIHTITNKNYYQIPDFKNYLQEKLKNFQDLQTRSNLEANEIERRCIQVDRQSDLKEHLNSIQENLREITNTMEDRAFDFMNEITLDDDQLDKLGITIDNNPPYSEEEEVLLREWFEFNDQNWNELKKSPDEYVLQVIQLLRLSSKNDESKSEGFKITLFYDILELRRNFGEFYGKVEEEIQKSNTATGTGKLLGTLSANGETLLNQEDLDKIKNNMDDFLGEWIKDIQGSGPFKLGVEKKISDHYKDVKLYIDAQDLLDEIDGERGV